MKRSYIVLSLIVSQALCADTSTDLVANFGSISTSSTTGLESVKKPDSSASSSQVDAEYGSNKDWIGSTSYLKVNASDLTFTFKASQESNLVISNNFSFTNQISQDSTSPTIAKITLTKSNSSSTLNTLTFGSSSSTSYSSRITLGNNLNLKITSFSSVKVLYNLSIGVSSTLDVSEISSFSNDGGIVLEGKDSTLLLKDTLTNSGSILMKNNSKIQSLSTLAIQTSSTGSTTKQGSLIAQGSTMIESGNSDLTITNQDITIQNLISKNSDAKIVTDFATLTLQSKKANATLTLGKDTNGVVNILGEIGNTNTGSISGVDIPQSSHIGKMVLSGFQTLDLKNVNFSSVNLVSSDMASMTLNSGVLGLENTTIAVGDFSADSTTSAQNLNFGVSGSSTITLSGENAISATGALTITGTHNFLGSGSLDFVGESVNLGNGSSATLGVSSTGSTATIGVSGATINTNNLSITGLTLQAINSTLTNTSMTLSDSILEAIDSEENLAELKIIKGTSSASINIANGKSATLRGESIVIEEQTMTLKNGTNTPTTLSFDTEGGGIVFGKSNGAETKITGENTTIANNILNLNTSILTTKGKVTLDKLTINTNQDLTIVGTEKENSKGLFFTGGTTIDTGKTANSKTQYYALSFVSDFYNNSTISDSDKIKAQAYVSLASDTTFKASNFIFQNQNFNLTNATTGKGLNLYAYGNMSVDSSTSTPNASGSFIFTNTTFTDGSTASLNLYSGAQGAIITASNLTLDGVDLKSYLINGSSSAKTSLDLSARNNPDELGITALGGVSIDASSILSGFSDESGNALQGIGTNLNVGNSSKNGQLTITSDASSGDSFVFGGNLTIDSSSNSSTLAITTNGKSASTNNGSNGLKLEFRGGGLTAIGTNSNPVTLKAKDFTFSNVYDTDGTTVSASPFVKVQNTTLTLNGDTSMSKVDLMGTTYLIGGDSNEAKLVATNNGSNSGSNVTLKLHDVSAEGKASIQSNKLEFSDSNISVSNSDSSQGLLLKDVSSSLTDNTLTGTISSITLDSGKLSFQYNSNSQASIILNANSTLTSSGTSELKVNTIKVGKDSSGNDGLYSLNVTDGTFTLTESTAGTQLGAITLGTQQGSVGGNFEYKGNSGNSYNDLTLKGDLTSYGDSSITAQSFTISAKDSSNKENYTISSTGGELKLIAKNTTSNSLTATANIALSNGSLGYYGSDGTLASLTLDSSSSLSAYGDSTLQAKDLNLKGASVSASEGTLTLKGVSSSTTAGNVSVGNGGVLTLKNSNTGLATLRIADGKTLSLSANTSYVSPSSPLGGGEFGRVDVQSLLFESKEGGLIQISIGSSTSSSSYSDSLFALREGAVTLVSTQEGIKKKSSNASYSNITLEDITTSTSDFTSITLSPYLEMGKDRLGEEIVQNLLLDLRVSQTNVTQLIESIKDSSAKETMTSIVNSGNNALILGGILQSSDNAFKVGMAEYISSGNTAVVQTSLEYINGAISSLSDSMLASNKIFELIAMLKNANVESRMVRGKNPFLAKTQLSSFIKSFIGTAYASSDEDSLLLEEDTTPKYGELWATFDGAMSFSKEESGNSSLYGFSAGYDTLLGEMKNYLLGFYASYGYGAYSVNYARNNSHNFGLGLYTRMSFENSEVDLILSQNVGLNHTEVDLGASNSYVAQALKQTLGYNFYTTDVEARYGYVFKVGSEDSPYYFRPFGGINFALIVNSGARGDGEAELGIQSMITYQLSVNVGVEMRKYFGEENYLYVLPILQKGLLHDSGGANVGFYGAENIPLTPSYDVDTSMALYVGGQGNVGENLAVSGGVGVKIGFEKKDLLTNWNVGLRYKF